MTLTIFPRSHPLYYWFVIRWCVCVCVCVCDRLLVKKTKHVFEQVMLVDGSRHMSQEMIQKTFKAAEFLIKFIMKSRSLYDA